MGYSPRGCKSWTNPPPPCIYIYVFNWRIIALQYCVGFCCNINMTQPGVYVCAIPLELPLHPSTHPTPLGCHRAWGLSSWCHTENSHWLSNFTYGGVYVSMLLSHKHGGQSCGQSQGRRGWDKLRERGIPNHSDLIRSCRHLGAFGKVNRSCQGSCLWVFLVKNLIQLIRIDWFYNPHSFLGPK